MTIHLTKGEVLRLEEEESPYVGVMLPIEVDEEEMRLSHQWVANAFKGMTAPVELYIDFVDIDYEREVLGNRGALVAYSVVDIGIPILVTESDWQREYVDKERARMLQGLNDCGSFILDKNTKAAWDYLRLIHEIPKYVTPSTLITLKAIHEYLSGGTVLSESQLPIALLGCWASIMSDSTLSFIKG